MKMNTNYINNISDKIDAIRSIFKMNEIKVEIFRKYNSIEKIIDLIKKDLKLDETITVYQKSWFFEKNKAEIIENIRGFSEGYHASGILIDQEKLCIINGDRKIYFGSKEILEEVFCKVVEQMLKKGETIEYYHENNLENQRFRQIYKQYLIIKNLPIDLSKFKENKYRNSDSDSD